MTAEKMQLEIKDMLVHKLTEVRENKVPKVPSVKSCLLLNKTSKKKKKKNSRG